MAKDKFTFRKIIPVGKYRSFEPDSTEIKLNGFVVGSIDAPAHFSNKQGFGISFCIKDGNSFKNITLAKRLDSEQEAREFVNKNFSALTTKFDLYMQDK